MENWRPVENSARIPWSRGSVGSCQGDRWERLLLTACHCDSQVEQVYNSRIPKALSPERCLSALLVLSSGPVHWQWFSLPVQGDLYSHVLKPFGVGAYNGSLIAAAQQVLLQKHRLSFL